MIHKISFFNPLFKIFLLLFSALAVWFAYLFLLLFLLPSQRELVEDFYISPTVYDRNNTLFAARLSVKEEWLFPIPLKDMGKWLPKICIAVEDRRFYEHNGVDPLALLRAIGQNIKAKRVISGASTVSSQLIRLSHPRERNLKSKLFEFIQAVKLELELSKDEILELYLNRAPFGGTLRGVEAASRQYFGKRAKELSLSESAMLIALLRGPTYYRPDRNETALRERRDQILNLLFQKGIISEADFNLAKEETIPLSKYQMPAEARHYFDLLLETLSKEEFKWFRNKERFGIISSLDLKKQKQVEAFLKNYLASYSPDLTASLIALDNHSGEILVYVGNARYEHGTDKNWVDCVRARRSPGSILKPFLYLTAFERGFFIPKSLIADSPLAFSGIAPRNFDEKYRGPVTVGFALSESLNAPAIRVLRRIGYEDSLIALRRLGFSFLTQKSGFYGDSLILGGCEVNALQVANAYSVLARLGIPKPMSLVKQQGLNKNTEKADESLKLFVKGSELGKDPLFSESAAWFVADTLNNRRKVASLVSGTGNEILPNIAFKTGTSFGLRDAWCAAYTPRYTVVTWVGNMNGTSDKDLVGLRIAAPIALRILNDFMKTYMGTRSSDLNKYWYKMPDDIEEFQACSVSGQGLTPQCPSSIPALRIKNVSSTKPCSLHKSVGSVVQTIWPSELADFALKFKAQVRHSPKIQITSPLPKSKIFIRQNVKDQKISLVSEGGAGKIYWYIDKTFFAVQQSGEQLLWEMSEGRHSISVVDEAGKTDKIEINIFGIGSKAAPSSLLPVLNLELNTTNSTTQSN
ncbi:penicillin-binding protein 1C [Desulfovibrio litoralis]|uniref:peptidoglycan glycosyltransferase n=1 Tax=Desulfovibrio litoralis DSM 11393 TaxID=1121455 RepID=A0A1M7TER3_9BACT|nr:penicillin-binding protein 1C [Desulfovibrio litoralis]SHN69151.1 penicillin-binding protein 1C [Desulfovibrio litoralis DSM 11393]